MTDTALRVALKAQRTTGWHLPSGRFAFPVAVAFALILSVFGITVEGPFGVAALAGIILVLGLPHGALDFAHLQQSPVPTALGVGLYLAAAGATLGLWLIDPSFALLAFLAFAIRHFAEDWSGDLPWPAAFATSAAIVAAPALGHAAELRRLFTIVADTPRAAAIVDAAVLIAPLALVAGIVGVAMLATSGRRARAVETAAALIAITVLPPLIGFTLIFGLFHSPRHFAEGCRELGWPRGSAWRLSVLLPAIGGGLIALWLFASGAQPDIGNASISATFRTLSILTVPHMILPFAVGAWRDRGAGLPPFTTPDG